MRVRSLPVNVLWSVVLAGFLVSSTGCIGGLAQLFYLIKGHEIEADYSGFAGRRVAVVVVTDGKSYSSDSLSEKVEKFVSVKLASNIEDIELVSSDEKQNWISEYGWNETDFAALGSGLDADIVLGINMDDYAIHQGRTIYKGRAEVMITVVDVETGETTYSSGPDHLEFPENGRPAIQTDDRKFETFYLAWLTKKIARKFYKHDQLDEVADDATFGG